MDFFASQHSNILIAEISGKYATYDTIKLNNILGIFNEDNLKKSVIKFNSLIFKLYDTSNGSVSNSTSVAGIVKLKDKGIELNDGLFEVILIKNPQNIIELNGIISSVLARNFSNKYVTMLRSKKVHFKFNKPVKWTRDGESGGVHNELTLENMHTAIEILV